MSSTLHYNDTVWRTPMADPYLLSGSSVMKNLLGIKDAEALEAAEANITSIRLFVVEKELQLSSYGYEDLMATHRYIFGDIYEWAGTPRTIQIVKGERVLGGDTVRYSQPNNIKRDCEKALKKFAVTRWQILSTKEVAAHFAVAVARLWQVHPFREGNTRTIITFATQFAEAHGFRMDKTLLKESSAYVRDALVKASDGEYSNYGYLTKIFEDAILRG